MSVNTIWMSTRLSRMTMAASAVAASRTSRPASLMASAVASRIRNSSSTMRDYRTSGAVSVFCHRAHRREQGGSMQHSQSPEFAKGWTVIAKTIPYVRFRTVAIGRYSSPLSERKYVGSMFAHVTRLCCVSRCAASNRPRAKLRRGSEMQGLCSPR
jgi:hypothetical protein